MQHVVAHTPNVQRPNVFRTTGLADGARAVLATHVIPHTVPFLNHTSGWIIAATPHVAVAFNDVRGLNAVSNSIALPKSAILAAFKWLSWMSPLGFMWFSTKMLPT